MSDLSKLVADGAIVSSIRGTDIFHGMRDPSLPGKQDIGLTGATLLSLVSSRRPRDRRISDGATSNRVAQAHKLSADANVASRNTVIPIRIPAFTAAPAADCQVFGLQDIATSLGSNRNNAFCVLFLATGALYIRQNGASTAANRILQWAGFSAAYANKGDVHLVLNMPGDSTATPGILANGVDIAANFSLTTATPPNWMPSTLDCTMMIAGLNWPAGEAPVATFGLGSWTAAEALSWSQTGLDPTWWAAFTGSAVAPNTAALTNNDVAITGYSATATSWSGTVVSYSTIRFRDANGDVSFVRGQKYRLDYTVVSSAAAVLLTTGTTVATLQTSPGTYSVEFYAPSSLIYMWPNGNGAYSFTDIRLTKLGPVIKPVIQCIPVVADNSDNCIPGYTLGMTPVTERNDWIIQGETSTSGNQQLLGNSVFNDATKHVFDANVLIANKGASTRTVSLGSASGGAQYASAVSVPAGKKMQALITMIPATVNIWVASDGTDKLRITLRGRKAA